MITSTITKIKYYPSVVIEGTGIILNLNTEKMENGKVMGNGPIETKSSKDNWFISQLDRLRGINGELDQIAGNLTNSTRRLGGAFEKPTEASPSDKQAEVESNLDFLNTELNRLSILVKSLSDASIRLNELT